VVVAAIKKSRNRGGSRIFYCDDTEKGRAALCPSSLNHRGFTRIGQKTAQLFFIVMILKAPRLQSLPAPCSTVAYPCWLKNSETVFYCDDTEKGRAAL
jgi:hypothetical protein